MTNAIDLSFSALDVSALAGVELVIQDLWTGAMTPQVCNANLDAALGAGRLVAGYMCVNPSIPDNVYMALKGIPPAMLAALAFVAIDCELYSTLTPERIRLESDRLAGRLPGRPRVIYTVESYWRDVIGNSPAFGDHRLWNARPGRPFSPFGAWLDEAAELGVQTTGTTDLGSMQVDLNDFKIGELMATDPRVDSLTIRAALTGATQANDMRLLVAQLVYFGVLPAGTQALKAAV